MKKKSLAVFSQSTRTFKTNVFYFSVFRSVPRPKLRYGSPYTGTLTGGQGFLAQNGERVGGVSTCTPSPPSKGGRSLKTPQGGCFLTPAFTETLRLGLHSEANAEFENLGILKFGIFFAKSANPGTLLVDRPYSVREGAVLPPPSQGEGGA